MLLLLAITLAIASCATTFAVARRTSRSRSTYAVVAVTTASLIAVLAGTARAAPAIALLVGSALLVAVARPKRDAAAAAPSESEPSRTSVPTILAITLAGWLIVIDLLQGAAGAAKVASFGLTLGSLLVAGALARRRTLTAADAVVAGLAMISALTLHGLVIGDAWRACSDGKCSAAGALYTAGLDSENFLAIVATITFALALGMAPSRSRWATLLLMTAIVLATGSRTSLLVLLVIAATAAVLHLPDAFATAPARRRRVPPLGGALMAGAITVLGFYLLIDARQDSFSSRGNIWIRAVEAVEGSRWTGLGASAWGPLQAVGVLPQHFAHSQYLYVYFAGGIVGLVTFGLLLWSLFQQPSAASWRLLFHRVAPSLALALLGLTEVVWNPIAFDGFSWMLVVVIAVGAAWSGPDPKSGSSPHDSVESEQAYVPMGSS